MLIEAALFLSFVIAAGAIIVKAYTLNANGPGSTLLEHSKRAVARGLRMRPNPRSGF
jgi:hypothetical protein